MLRAITDLGDSAFLLPASIVLFVYLLALGERRKAVLWGAAVLLNGALTVGSKVAFFALFHFDGHWAPFAIRSPSGHTSLSAMFYISAAVLMALRRPPAIRLGLAAGAAALVGGVAVTRILLGAHTPGEVAVGLVMGAGCAAWFARAVLREPVDRLRWQPLAVAIVGLAALVHALHLDGSSIIGSVAHQVRLMVWPTFAS
jgi:membrane-associated phospholipid phosphatase